MVASEVLEDEPSSVSSALASKEKTKWLNVMNEEMNHFIWTIPRVWGVDLKVIGWSVVKEFSKEKMVFQELIKQDSR